MNTKIVRSGKITLGSIIFVVSIFVSLFWWGSKFIDFYQFKLMGIVFEILWLPAIAALPIIPIISVVFWKKEKFTLKSFYPYSILIIIVTILAMTLIP
jgi:hypothetical protein